MKYIGLLTDNQKRAGFFISQDEDFVYLFYATLDAATIKAIFLYSTATIKEVRDTCQHHLENLDH